MPVGPRGEKRPVSVVQNAHRVFQIATGQAEEEYVDGVPSPQEQVPFAAVKKPKKRKKAKRA